MRNQIWIEVLGIIRIKGFRLEQYAYAVTKWHLGGLGRNILRIYFPLEQVGTFKPMAF